MLTSGTPTGGTLGMGQTPAEQLGYYKLAYAIAESSINSGDALRGVAFWRWDNVDPQAQLTGFDQEATISASSPLLPISFSLQFNPCSDPVLCTTVC